MFRGKKEGTEPHWGELTAGMPPARSRFKDLLRRLQEAPNFLSATKASQDLPEDQGDSRAIPEPAGAGKCPLGLEREHKQPWGFPAPPRLDGGSLWATARVSSHWLQQSGKTTATKLQQRKQRRVAELWLVQSLVSLLLAPDRMGCSQRAELSRQHSRR